jgi:UDP-N-acetylglucosamine--N-acetylmuramyl-(pentapeptide) pyrophosphoryl-undecaprenol N-acetylglucosamine transferase
MNQTKCRALIMAGGTGGHIFPGLAVAKLLQKNGWDVQWLGNPQAMEGRLVPAQGLILNKLVFSGLRGKGFSSIFFAPGRLLRALFQAWCVLRRFRPTVVLGMGGYVAFPGAMMASLLGIPLVIHEQNSVAGLTNRILAKLADRVLVAFPQTLPKGHWVGNPVREELLDLPSPEIRYAYQQQQHSLKLLVVGGSLGAAVLNQVVPEALALLKESHTEGVSWEVTHQAGQAHLEQLQQQYAQAGIQARCLPFVEDMAQALSRCDLVICRAGAMTVAEVATVGVAALFVPYPYAVDDHQTSNARFLVEQQAAWLCPQYELTPQYLAQWLRQRAQEPETLRRVACAAKQVAKLEATREVVQHLEAVVRS